MKRLRVSSCRPSFRTYLESRMDLEVVLTGTTCVVWAWRPSIHGGQIKFYQAAATAKTINTAMNAAASAELAVTRSVAKRIVRINLP